MEPVGESAESHTLRNGPTTTRRDKNRDAARKTRRKQTERADELHEELQTLERSNSALQKEIAQLKKEAEKYEKILLDHEPNCFLGLATSKSRSFVQDTATHSALNGHLHHLKEGAVLSPSPAAAQTPLALSTKFSHATPNPLESSILTTAHSLFRDESLFSAQLVSEPDNLHQAFSQSDDARLFGDTSSTKQPSVSKLQFHNPTEASLVCPTDQNTDTQNHHSSQTPLLSSSHAPPLSLSQDLPSDEPLSPLSLLLLQDMHENGSFCSKPLNMDEISCWISDQTNID